MLPYQYYFAWCLGKSYYVCKCKIGWAGDGKVCGPDRELDGWPDFDLPCQVTIECISYLIYLDNSIARFAFKSSQLFITPLRLTQTKPENWL